MRHTFCGVPGTLCDNMVSLRGGGAGRLSSLLSQVVNLLDQAASYRFGFRRLDVWAYSKVWGKLRFQVETRHC